MVHGSSTGSMYHPLQVVQPLCLCGGGPTRVVYMLVCANSVCPWCSLNKVFSAVAKRYLVGKGRSKYGHCRSEWEGSDQIKSCSRNFWRVGCFQYFGARNPSLGFEERSAFANETYYLTICACNATSVSFWSWSSTSGPAWWWRCWVWWASSSSFEGCSCKSDEDNESAEEGRMPRSGGAGGEPEDNAKDLDMGEKRPAETSVDEPLSVKQRIDETEKRLKQPGIASDGPPAKSAKLEPDAPISQPKVKAAKTLFTPSFAGDVSANSALGSSALPSTSVKGNVRRIVEDVEMYDEDEVEMDYGYFYYLCDSEAVNGYTCSRKRGRNFLESRGETQAWFLWRRPWSSAGVRVWTRRPTERIFGHRSWEIATRGCNWRCWSARRSVRSLTVRYACSFWLEVSWRLAVQSPDGCKRVSWWECKQWGNFFSHKPFVYH